jgi:hypothetical protein
MWVNVKNNQIKKCKINKNKTNKKIPPFHQLCYTVNKEVCYRKASISMDKWIENRLRLGWATGYSQSVIIQETSLISFWYHQINQLVTFNLFVNIRNLMLIIIVGLNICRLTQWKYPFVNMIMSIKCQKYAYYRVENT